MLNILLFSFCAQKSNLLHSMNAHCLECIKSMTKIGIQGQNNIYIFKMFLKNVIANSDDLTSDTIRNGSVMKIFLYNKDLFFNITVWLMILITYINESK